MVVCEDPESLFLPKASIASTEVRSLRVETSTHLPFEKSQRGDSGTNQMRQTWKMEGSACSADGMRHDQLFLMLNVPYVVQAALENGRTLVSCHLSGHYTYTILPRNLEVGQVRVGDVIGEEDTYQRVLYRDDTGPRCAG